MTELEKTQNLFKEYDMKYNDSFDAHCAIKYAMIYHQEALTELLRMELPKQLQNTKYIQSIIDLASTNYCKVLVDELAKKYITINIEKINGLLEITSITEDTIVNISEDLTQAFYSTETILICLSYESDPLGAFERFLRRQRIKMTLGKTDFRFCFSFINSHANENHVNYYCNNICEFLKLCSHSMLEKCSNELVESVCSPIKAIQTDPLEEIDYDKIVSLHGMDLYEYLSKIEQIKVNYVLEDLYLLLNHDKITLLQDDDVMDVLVQKIILGEM